MEPTIKERALAAALIALAVVAGVVAFGPGHNVSLTLLSVIGVTTS